MKNYTIAYKDFTESSTILNVIASDIISVETITVLVDSEPYFNRRTHSYEQYQKTETTYRMWYKVEL